MTTTVHELAMIESLTRHFTRSPRQLNGLQESDAELVRLGNELILAVTTDTIAEEITAGLYADPWLAGWMTVMANFSDIAAVGAEPLGILIAETIPGGTDPTAISRMQEGIHDACTTCGTWVLGGDTNTGDRLQLTGTAVGVISGGTALTRRGIRPGDSIYCSGPLGGGNAFAAAVLSGASTRPSYIPTARLHEGRALRSVATACMDTSDGLLATLDQLGRVNSIGFELQPDWEAFLGTGALSCARAMGLPAWLFLAGPHGEFELVFSAPEPFSAGGRGSLTIGGRACPRIGRATAGDGIVVPGVGSFGASQRAAIRNMEPPDGSSMRAYVAELMNIAASAQYSTPS